MPTSCSFQTKSMHSLANWIFGDKNVDMFPNFANCVQETGIYISPLINTVAQHVEGLKQQFGHYFTEDFN